MKNDPSYDRLLLLDRLEELREDMVELNVRSIEDLEARIAALEAEIADADVGRVHEPV
ncbi:MAG: DUF1192 domain-containing protein [Thermomicrobiales bacterium]|nr:DUF1192 domain-containing protein [Thermomicrobiales bacterium]